MAQITISGEYVQDMLGGRVPASEVYRYEDGRRWNPRHYEWAVRRVLGYMDLWQAGRALRAEIAACSGSLRIIPWPEPDPHLPQAQAIPDAPLGGCPASEHPWGRGGIRSRLVCTGTGSDVAVKFTPAHFGPTRSGSRAMDAVLFHELVHAVRYLQARFQAAPARSIERYSNVEEFFAVVVTNVYLSEQGVPLRHGHSDSITVLANPDTWMNHPHNRAMVERFVAENRAFSMLLARVRSKFNPFLDLLLGEVLPLPSR